MSDRLLICPGIVLRLQLRVRRFFCDHPVCEQAIFTERLPGLVAPCARKTVRLAQVLEVIGLAVGGGRPVFRRAVWDCFHRSCCPSGAAGGARRSQVSPQG
jgi:hypothetical protein